MKSIIVKKSKINGKGVFANRGFKKGERVLKWQPKKILTSKEISRFSLKEKTYIARLGKSGYALMGFPEKYVNHSCDANTNVKNGSDIAVRDIMKGEEITSNYIKEGELDKFVCNCKSKKCIKAVRN